MNYGSMISANGVFDFVAPCIGPTIQPHCSKKSLFAIVCSSSSGEKRQSADPWCLRDFPPRVRLITYWQGFFRLSHEEHCLILHKTRSRRSRPNRSSDSIVGDFPTLVKVCAAPRLRQSARVRAHLPLCCMRQWTVKLVVKWRCFSIVLQRKTYAIFW